MRSVFVVVLAPILQLFGGIRKAQEPVCIQALIPEAAVEALDETVLHWLAGLDVMPIDTCPLTPFENGLLVSSRTLGSSAGQSLRVIL